MKMLLLLLSLFLSFISANGKDYHVVVKTKDKLWAGTDATVKIKVQGTLGLLERQIKCDCERGDKEDFKFSDWDIGYVKGMQVYRGNEGPAPGWDLDYIIIKIAGAKDSIFNHNKEVSSGWTTLTLSCTDGNVINSQGYCDVADVNECKTSNPCIYPATCQNTVGSYICNCPSGYIPKPGTNNQCKDVDECQSSSRCASPSTCVNTGGSYHCQCPSGYNKKAGTKDQCEDIDECANDPCSSLISTCENFPGDYRCICKAGYVNVDAKNCQNVDECSEGKDSCNKTSSDCIDSDGSYRCRCKPGYTQGANNKICEAVGCGALSTPSGSNLEPVRCTYANSNFYGDKCVMKCQLGYVISDISHGIFTCGSSGRWEGTVATCNPVTCPKLPAILNGNLLPPSCASTGSTYNHECTYYCSSGYSLQGNSARKCLADGTWDGSAPTCKKIEVKPWIRCPDIIIQDLLPGESSADVSGVWKEPTSNLQPSQITINPPEISSSYQFPPGTTKITWTASNAVGSESCSIYVIISDKEAPSVTNCPKEIFEISSGPKAVTWAEPIFSDNVKVTKVDKSHTSGSTFQLGTTYITYDAQDAAGNRVKCQFKVNLKKPQCEDPDGPDGGNKSCSSFGGTNFCTVTCKSGSQLYKATASFWQCNSGVWSPSDKIPDCVEAVKKDANIACQEIQIKMNVSIWGQIGLYCAKCPKGMHKSSEIDCSPCPAGTYNDQQGQLKCTLKCPAGTSSLAGAKSSSDCKPVCPAGQFSSTGLGPNCQYCPRDAYQNKVQQKSCTPCPNGTFTLSTGSNSLSDCGSKPIVSRIEPLIANIKEGESVSVSCFASGVPTPTYIWKFLKDIPASFLGKMSQASITDAKGAVIGSKLTITGSRYENTGSYECGVSNTHGKDIKVAQINVAKVIDYGSGSDEPL